MRALLLTAIEAAIAAGEEIMTIYSGTIDVVLKDDESPLTVADENANAIINTFLEPTNLPIISEENKQTAYAERKNWETCWMVDPLDGTKEFIKRNGEFTVNIALIQDNKPVLGVIYEPATKTLYYGIVAEQKAFKLELEAHKMDIAILKNAVEIQPLKSVATHINIVGSRSHKSEATDAFIKTLEAKGHVVNVVSKGSSLKFCLVAEGEAHIYPRFAPTMEWDTAAGHAICSAVGLKVTQVDQDQALVYNKENLLNPYFLVE